MRYLSTLVILLIAAAITFALVFFNKKVKAYPWITKALALGLAAVMLARYVYDQPPIYDLIGLDSPLSPFNSPTPRPLITALAILMVWIFRTATFVIIFNEFFNYRTLRNLTGAFALPMSLITTVFIETYTVASIGRELFSFSSPRFWMIIVECALALALSLYRIVALAVYRRGSDELTDDCRMPVPRGIKEIGNFFYALIFAIIVLMPCYAPQAFIGEINMNIRLYDLTEAHRFMIYLALVFPFVTHHLLKNKKQDEKRVIMMFLSLALLWSYLGRWDLDMWKDPPSWPLHLCNTAMFLIPLCIIFNMRRLYNFSLFVNVMGAMMAMILPTELESISAIETARVSFWLNHWAAFAMPILLVSLKLFNRPKFKEWVYAIIAFMVYYASVLFINPYFTAKYGHESDFFFINGDFIVSTLGQWAERTRDFTVNVTVGGHTLTFYPLYQALFFVVYIGFTVAIWFIFALLFSSWDAAEDRRLRERDYKRMKKELKEYLGGKSIDETISGDDSPRFAIKHFCKRYGSNKHYSVKDVSFEVHAGEIFGFLGPNGAGKSTIIKSMVGIQTITSGNIEICGYDVEMQPVQAKLNVGFVPDHYALYENLTGREYINYIADLFKVDQEYRDKTIEKYVDRFQLTGSFDNQMKTYSHGMKQKITIMSALVHNPKVWILDEPLTGLDPTSIHEVKECMKEHAAKGNIVFFSSHIIDVVEKLCDRIAIIKKGQLRACTSLAELNEKGIALEQFYLDIINTPDDADALVYEEAPKAQGEAATV